jgi:hypothetical protein
MKAVKRHRHAGVYTGCHESSLQTPACQCLRQASMLAAFCRRWLSDGILQTPDMQTEACPAAHRSRGAFLRPPSSSGERTVLERSPCCLWALRSPQPSCRRRRRVRIVDLTNGKERPDAARHVSGVGPCRQAGLRGVCSAAAMRAWEWRTAVLLPTCLVLSRSLAAGSAAAELPEVKRATRERRRRSVVRPHAEWGTGLALASAIGPHAARSTSCVALVLQPAVHTPHALAGAGQGQVPGSNLDRKCQMQDACSVALRRLLFGGMPLLPWCLLRAPHAGRFHRQKPSCAVLSASCRAAALMLLGSAVQRRVPRTNLQLQDMCAAPSELPSCACAMRRCADTDHLCASWALGGAAHQSTSVSGVTLRPLVLRFEAASAYRTGVQDRSTAYCTFALSPSSHCTCTSLTRDQPDTLHTHV